MSRSDLFTKFILKLLTFFFLFSFLETLDPKSRQIRQRKYHSAMADQICYSVLCVFSYVAASRELKKKQGTLKPPTSPAIHHKPVEKSEEKPFTNVTTVANIQSPAHAPVVVQQTSPSHSISKTTTVTEIPKSPVTSVEPLEPPKPASVSQKPIPAERPSIPDRPDKIPPARPPQPHPRIPARAPSLPNRGPPPAIPPRIGVKSESMQITTQNAPRPLVKQASINSIPPQCTPQPPPKFVIPQRQNSKSSNNHS